MTTSYIQGALIDIEHKKVLEALRADLLVSATNATVVQADLDATEATVIADMTAIRAGVIAALTAIDTLAGALNTLATKLNADAGVTDTNYAAANAVNNASTSSPAALTTS